MSNNIWAIAQIQKQPTQHHSGFIWKLTLINLEGDSAITYADPANRNFHNWSDLINRHQAGHGVFIENCVMSKRKNDLIDADSKPTIWHETETHEEAMDALDALFNDTPQERLMKDLFDF